jgi:hypothetical protein
MAEPPVKVKTLAQARYIASLIRKYNPEAAAAYLDSFSRRRSIEEGALDNWLGVTRRDG